MAAGASTGIDTQRPVHSASPRNRSPQGTNLPITFFSFFASREARRVFAARGGDHRVLGDRGFPCQVCRVRGQRVRHGASCVQNRDRCQRSDECAAQVECMPFYFFSALPSGRISGQPSLGFLCRRRESTACCLCKSLGKGFPPSKTAHRPERGLSRHTNAGWLQDFAFMTLYIVYLRFFFLPNLLLWWFY